MVDEFHLFNHSIIIILQPLLLLIIIIIKIIIIPGQNNVLRHNLQKIVLILFSSWAHLVLILCSSCVHLVLISYSSCTHLVLISYSSHTHHVLIMYSEVEAAVLEVVGRHLTDPQLLSLSVGERESGASLVLGQGSPLLMGGLRPVPPNLVYCGMMQCRPARPLPADLQDLMDAATQGVVLVSFGSVLQGSQVINILYTSCTQLVHI